MGSNARRASVGAAAFVATAVLLFFGTGLTPLWWLTWLAPLPVLLVAPRVPALVAAVVASAAWGVGGLNIWSYERDRLEVPLPVALLHVIVPALLFALAVLLFRGLVRQRRLVLAAVAVPAVWASAEYLVSVTTPAGAFWSLAYTQTEVLPVAQLASLTGIWGITFLLMGLAAAGAVVLAPGAARRARVGVGVAALVLVAVSAGYAQAWLAGPPPAGPSRSVALLAAGQQGDWAPVDTPRGQEKLAEAIAHLRALPSGTDIAVLPEGAFVTASAGLPRITQPLASLARDRQMDIVAGVIVTGEDANYNAAMFFPAAGGEPLTYRKQHMIPGVEPYQPGNQLVFVPGSDPPAGVAICKDLDFPGLAREYRRGGATVMLLPAWDFDVDGWLHARMAVMRGVENGFSVVRSAANGKLTISDPNARVLAEGTTDSRSIVTVTANVSAGRAGTLYTRWGDWFAWLCLVLTVVIVCRLLFLTRRVRAAPPRAIHALQQAAPASAGGLQGDSAR